jgi:hypothetical protein
MSHADRITARDHVLAFMAGAAISCVVLLPIPAAMFLKVVGRGR